MKYIALQWVGEGEKIGGCHSCFPKNGDKSRIRLDLRILPLMSKMQNYGSVGLEAGMPTATAVGLNIAQVQLLPLSFLMRHTLANFGVLPDFSIPTTRVG